MPTSRATSKPARPALQHNAPVFAALGDRTRLILLLKLCNEAPQSISRLALGSQLTRQAITKHLRVLQHAGLVRARRRGREQLFEPQPAPLDEAARALASISRQWDDALTRLKKFVEQ